MKMNLDCGEKWAAGVQFLWEWGGHSSTGKSGWRSSTVGTSESNSYGWHDEKASLWQQSRMVELVCRAEL